MTRGVSEDNAAVLSIGHNGVSRRLMSLELNGLVESRRFGNNLAWRLTGDGCQFLNEDRGGVGLIEVIR